MEGNKKVNTMKNGAYLCYYLPSPSCTIRSLDTKHRSTTIRISLSQNQYIFVISLASIANVNVAQVCLLDFLNGLILKAILALPATYCPDTPAARSYRWSYSFRHSY